MGKFGIHGPPAKIVFRKLDKRGQVGWHIARIATELNGNINFGYEILAIAGEAFENNCNLQTQKARLFSSGRFLTPTRKGVGQSAAD